MSFKTALAAALLAALLAIGIAASAGASVQVGSSGWQWGNPLPQGNTLRTMSFAGTTGYAAGDFGTLLKTTDGGATWSGLPVGTFADLTVVQAIDGDAVVAGGGCVARRSVDGGATFTSIAFTAVESRCRVGLRDLSFVTRDLGYLLLRDGSVFVTDDGGTQFAPRTAVPSTSAAGGFAPAGAIVFIDARTGYATSGSELFQTLDGGVSWRLVANAGRAINELWFADARRGFAVGDGGLLLRSDDGGATWSEKPLGNVFAYTGINCANTQLCLLTTAGGGALVRTLDAGETPGALVTPATDPIHAAAFASPSRVVAAGANGTTVVSDDGGVTFTRVGGRLGGRYAAIRAGGDAGTAYAPGTDGALAKTTDGGRSWATRNVPTTADLIDVAFPSGAVGYALDADGGLFRTANGGTTWKTLGTGSTRRPRAVLAPDESVALVIGPRGVRRSVDEGETFVQVRAAAVLRTPLVAAAASPRGSAVFAWGPTALVRSVDDGRTWRALPRPSRARIEQASFSSATTGLVRDAAGRVWRTSDAGRRWTPLSSIGTNAITGMAVRSAREAYLIVPSFGNRTGGYLLHTEDAGATWQPQRVVDAPIVSAGLAVSSTVDYLLAGETSLLFSTSGGVAGSSSELRLATRRPRLRRAARITVTGRLRPAAPGAEVTVSARAPGASGWTHETVPVASNGTFATAWHVQRGTTTFVAQWAGDFQSAGAGSRPLTVTVRPQRGR